MEPVLEISLKAIKIDIPCLLFCKALQMKRTAAYKESQRRLELFPLKESQKDKKMDFISMGPI